MQGHDLLAKAEADTGTSGFGSEKRYKNFGNGLGYDDIGYAAPVVRRNVWRHGCLYHGWLVGSQFVDYRGVARDVLFDIQDKSGVILDFKF